MSRKQLRTVTLQRGRHCQDSEWENSLADEGAEIEEVRVELQGCVAGAEIRW